jgi:hypothetical protein
MLSYANLLLPIGLEQRAWQEHTLLAYQDGQRRTSYMKHWSNYYPVNALGRMVSTHS